MKIKREKLLALVTGELERLKAEVERRNASEASRAQVARELHERTAREVWERFAEVIRRRTAAHEPVEWTDVPIDLRLRSGWNNSLRFYQPPSRSTTRPEDYAEYRRLDALRRLIEVTEDEVLSTYGLERAGFRLEKLVRQAAELT